MAYSKTNWVNGTTPAISAANLNKMEQGIYDATLNSNHTINYTVRNGSYGNAGNQNAVTLGIFPIDIVSNRYFLIQNDRPLTEGADHYKYGYAFLKSFSGKPTYNASDIVKTVGFSGGVLDGEAIDTASFPNRDKIRGVAIEVVQYGSDNTTLYPLRQADYDDYHIKIVGYSEGEKSDIQKTYMYFGNQGNFNFYEPLLFRSDGRCPWRVSSDSLNIKIAEKNVVSFTNAQILNSLTNDDKFTDSNNVTWICLRAGYALVYDENTSTLSSIQISGNSVLGTNIYPVLMAYLKTFVGGYLVNKFIYDAYNYQLRHAITRPVFAYIGNAGKFNFLENNIFDNSARCKFRFSTNLVIKVAGVSPNKEFTNAQIISSLNSDEVYTDSDNVDWIYLKAGRALAYDRDTQTLSSIDITSTALIKSNYYILLMVWSGQAVGGLLFEKFLYDITQKNQISGALTTDSENVKYVGNAEHRTSVSDSSLSILHFSDIHKDLNALDRISTFLRNHSSMIDDAICTGDICGNSYEQISSWWNPSILTCIGNHDTASYDSGTGYDWTALSMADRSAYYIEPFESSWGITHTEGTSYYYKDYSSQKVRLIVIDAMLYLGDSTISEADAQTSWLEGLLSSAITNNYHVLIATHSPHRNSTSKNCNFSKYGATTITGLGECNTPNDVTDAVTTAIGNGLKFIGYICGHTHQDNFWDVDNDGKQVFYTITCANVYQSAQWAYSDQYRSATLDAFNIINIDTVNQVVRIVRCGGADLDNMMRSRKGISFKYGNWDLIGQS